MVRRWRWGFLGLDGVEDAAPTVDLADVDGAVAAEAGHQFVGQLPLAADRQADAAVSVPDHLVVSPGCPLAVPWWSRRPTSRIRPKCARETVVTRRNESMKGRESGPDRRPKAFLWSVSV